MQVVCLNFNDYLGRGDVYVERLFSMCDRHLNEPFIFRVVTEDDITSGRIGWFAKLDLLEMFDGDVLYLDLDVVITASISGLVNCLRSDRTKIWARDDWSYPVTNPRNGREATINSSVMLWHGRKDMSGVTQRMLDETHGDQGIITQLFWPNGIGLLPNDSISSYKYDVLQGRAPGAICAFHGEPKQHQVNDQKFVREHWR